MSYCWKCGARLNDEDKFCSVCGAGKAKVTREELTVSSDNLIEKVKQLLHESNVTRIIFKDEKRENTARDPSHSRSNRSAACTLACRVRAR